MLALVCVGAHCVGPLGPVLCASLARPRLACQPTLRLRWRAFPLCRLRYCCCFCPPSWGSKSVPCSTPCFGATVRHSPIGVLSEMVPGRPLAPEREGGTAAVYGPGPGAFPDGASLWCSGVPGVMWLVWLWDVVVCVCCMLSTSMQVVFSPFSMVRGRGPLALVPTWLGGSSWRGRFGDSGVSMKASSIAARAAAARAGGSARSMILSVY